MDASTTYISFIELFNLGENGKCQTQNVEADVIGYPFGEEEDAADVQVAEDSHDLASASKP